MDRSGFAPWPREERTHDTLQLRCRDGHAHFFLLPPRKGPPSLRRRRGCQTRPGGARIRRPPPRHRSQDHPPRTGRPQGSSRPPPRTLSQKRGGRKRKIEATPELVENFQAVLKDHTAGSPTEEEVIWTNLTTTDIAKRLTEREIGRAHV